MRRKKQIREVTVLDQQLTLQRMKAKVSARGPIASLQRLHGWPVVIIGFSVGAIIGQMKIYTTLTWLLSASIAALRMEQLFSHVLRRL